MDTLGTHGTTTGPADTLLCLRQSPKDFGSPGTSPSQSAWAHTTCRFRCFPNLLGVKVTILLPGVPDSLVLLEAVYVKRWTTLSASKHRPWKRKRKALMQSLSLTLFNIYFYFMYECLAGCIPVHGCSAQGDQKRALSPIELKLKAAVWPLFPNSE